MKRLLLLPAMTFLAVLTFNANAQNNHVKQVKNSMADQPYKVENTNIRIGNMAYAQKVLWAWKAFDDNTLDNTADLFTEDVVGTFPDGSMVKGRADFLKMAKEYRNTLASVSSMVNACTTLVGAEHPESQAVSIWGTETDTHKDGTVTKTHLNEIWFFNKDGKVYEFHQMSAKDSPDMK
jgi:archaellum component FlaF (FlaF/FlaG flagellin family)